MEIFEIINQWPLPFQIAILILFFGGSGSGILGLFFGFIRERSRARDKARLEALENQQIQIQSDADNRKAQWDFVQQLIADIPKNRETWQATIKDMAQKNHERAEQVFVIMDKTNTALDGAASSIVDLSNVLETQSSRFEQLEQTNKETQRIVTENTQATRATVESIKTTITQQFELVENALKTLDNRFDNMLTRQTTQLENQDDIHRELRAVSDAIKTMGLVVTNIHTLVKKLDPPTPPPKEIPLTQPDTEKKSA